MKIWFWFLFWFLLKEGNLEELRLQSFSYEKCLLNCNKDFCCFLHCQLKHITIALPKDFSGPYFPAFGLNTEIYTVNFRIQSECRKTRTRKSLNRDTFYRYKTCSTYSAKFQTLSNCYDYFLRFQYFLIYLENFLWSILSSPNLSFLVVAI